MSYGCGARPSLCRESWGPQVHAARPLGPLRDGGLHGDALATSRPCPWGPGELAPVTVAARWSRGSQDASPSLPSAATLPQDRRKCLGNRKAASEPSGGSRGEWRGTREREHRFHDGNMGPPDRLWGAVVGPGVQCQSPVDGRGRTGEWGRAAAPGSGGRHVVGPLAGKGVSTSPTDG